MKTLSLNIRIWMSLPAYLLDAMVFYRLFRVRSGWAQLKNHSLRASMIRSRLFALSETP
jgi:hypothetical protein